jgi:surface glycoprotein (TIGR04207 family)
MSRESRQAVRAVFLAAIMVISVFAAGIAFSGSAAAQEGVSSGTITLNEGDTVSISGDTLENQGAIDDQTNVSESKEIFDSLNGDIGQGLVVNLSGTSNGDVPAGITSDFNPQIRYEFTEPVTASNGDGSDIVAAVIYYSGSGESGVDYDYGSFQSDTNWQAVFITDDGGATNSVGNAETTTGNLGKIIEISVQRFVDEYESAEVESLSVNLLNQGNDDETVEYVTVGDQNIPLDQVGENETSVQIRNDYYTSIQSAADNAESGDTIQVGPGTYNESVTIDTADIKLEGPNADLSGTADRNEEATIEGAVEISADGVLVRGFAISPDEFSKKPAAGIFVNGGNSTVENNVVEGIRGDGSVSVHGVQVFKQSPDRLENITVSNNLIRDIDNDDRAGVGIKIQNQLRDVHVHDNTIQEVYSEGWTYGIVSTPSSKETVQPEDVLIEGNTIDSVGSGDEYDVFDDEESAPYPGVAVGLDTASGSVEEDPAANASELTVSQNDFVDVPTGVQNKDQSADLNATSNWWGSPNGPSAGSENTYNDGEQGTEISDNVEFTPWLDASTNNGGESFAPVTNNSSGQFASIQAAIAASGSNDTIELESGTYEESVTVSKNITLEGPNAGIEGRSDDRSTEANLTAPSSDENTISLGADTDVVVDGIGFTGSAKNYVEGHDFASLEVKHSVVIDADINGSGFVHAFKPGDVDRIEVTNSSIQGGEYNGHVIYLSGADVDTLEVSDNEFVDHGGGPFTMNLNSVSSGTIENNEIDSEGANGILLASGDSYTVVGNDIRGTDQAMAAAFGFSGDATIRQNTFDEIDEFPFAVGDADASGITFTRNNINDSGEFGVFNNGNGKLNARLNWWGSDRGPNGGSSTDVGDQVGYDPFLTTPIENIEVDDVGDTQQFAQDIYVPADQAVTAVGFPGPTDQTVGEAFSEFNGSIYEYNRTAGSFEALDGDDADREISSLDAFVITQSSNETMRKDVQVVIKYANAPADRESFGSPGIKTIEPGFNLIAPRGVGDAYDVFNSPSDREVIYGTYGQPEGDSAFLPVGSVVDSPFVATSFAPDQEGPVANPYSGYLVFTEEERTITTNVLVGVTADEVLNEQNLDRTAS